MAAIQANSPFPLFTDRGGDPLDGGFVYFGEPDLNPEESPKTVYYDAALTLATPQPLRTSAGYITRNGAPAAVYSDGSFSMTVRDRNSALIMYSPSAFVSTPEGVLLATNNLSDVDDTAAALANIGGANLTALAAQSGAGIMARTGAATYALRTITGTADRITVTNGNGVSGNPTIDVVKASTANAEAGTGDGVMDPPLVKAAIDAQFNVSGAAPKYACRAWVNFNGTGTVAIRASGNVSSITDNGTGNYTVNFTTAMPDANYSAQGAGHENVFTPGAPIAAFRDYLTSSVVVRTRAIDTNALVDSEYVNVAIFR